MHLILADIDKAYDKGLTCSYFDIDEIDSSLPDHRVKSLIASRFLLCESVSFFYNGSIDINFKKGSHGKPYIKNNNLFFNISHSGSVVALSLSEHTECGVDIERIRERNSLRELAKRVLSADEIAYFSTLSKEEAQKFFYRMWTVRECLLKHSGLGLVGLDSIKCHIDTLSITSINNTQGHVLSMMTDKEQFEPFTYFVSCFYTDRAPCVHYFDDFFKEFAPTDRQIFQVNYQ